jgi:hypothetical protein
MMVLLLLCLHKHPHLLRSAQVVYEVVCVPLGPPAPLFVALFVAAYLSTQTRQPMTQARTKSPENAEQQTTRTGTSAQFVHKKEEKETEGCSPEDMLSRYESCRL